mgnify:CR=1 FL=1
MKKTIYLAGGCFWGTQKYLDQLQGVLTTEVGFANGNTEAPTYEEVCHNNTGHAETVRVEYDAQQLPLARLLKFYFASINPTSLNRQGEDSGSQYRTGIYYVDAADEEVIREALRERGYTLTFEAPTNQVFVTLDHPTIERLQAHVRMGFMEKADNEHTVMRLCTSWATTDEQVDQLIALL